MFKRAEASSKLMLNLSIVDVGRLRGHERTEEARLKALKAQIESDARLMRPIVVDRETDVVLDGHHRMQALRLLGCSRIPVCYVSYASERIGVMSMIKGLKITKSEVVQAGLNGKPFPPKTTWHYLTSTPNTLNHISFIQRRTDTPLTDLR
jgi:hypothetical protein